MPTESELSIITATAVAAALAQQSGHTGQVLTLPEYHGIGSPVSFKSWFDKCKSLFDAFAIKEETRKLAHLRLMLKGTAETALSSYLLINPTVVINNTNEFYSKLYPLFIDPSFPQVIRRKLQMLKQTGSLSEYIAAEADLIGDYKDITDNERIYLFKYGLDPKFVDILNLKNPATFLEAITHISKHGNAIDMRFAQNIIHESMDMDVDNINLNKINITKHTTNDNKFILLDDSFAESTFLYNINGTEVPINVAATSGRSYLNNNLFGKRTKSIEGTADPIDVQKNTPPEYEKYEWGEDSSNNNSDLDLNEKCEEYFTPCTSPIPQEKTKHKRKNSNDATNTTKNFKFNRPQIKKRARLFNIDSINPEIDFLIGELNNNDPNSPYGLISINGAKTKILFDSGAARCFISGKIASKLNLALIPVKSEIKAITANGQALKITKQTNINLPINNILIPTTAYIFPLVHVDIIIGYDWWSKYKLTPSYESNIWKITYNDNTILLNLEIDSIVPIVSINHINQLTKKGNIQEIYKIFVSRTDPEETHTETD
ncbi:hypothetical protein BB561_006384, partial [Smittium simulii]